MNRVTTRIVAGLLPVLLSAQLPPEIQLDRYLLRAEQRMQEGNFLDAMESLERILDLQQQHGIEVPEAFQFTYAQVSLRVGLYDQAIESVTRYLTLTGGKGSITGRPCDCSPAPRRRRRQCLRPPKRHREGWKSQGGWRRRRGRGREARKKAEAVIAAMEFVWIPGGGVRMGSTSSRADDDERPRTRVRISQGFTWGSTRLRRSYGRR